MYYANCAKCGMVIFFSERFKQWFHVNYKHDAKHQAQPNVLQTF